MSSIAKTLPNIAIRLEQTVSELSLKHMTSAGLGKGTDLSVPQTQALFVRL